MLSDDLGQSMVELALLLPVLVFGLICGADLARAYALQLAVQNGGPAGERAQALVELSLLVPVMLLIITGVIGVGRAVWEENTLAYAAREGTRFLIVHGSTGAPLPDRSPGATGPTGESNCLTVCPTQW